jgi:hypothetical protein
MAIHDFLTGAVRELAFQNYAVAMACVCTALDATAKAEFGGSTRQRCLKYINRYLDIITLVGFGGAIVAVPGSTLKVNDPINRTKTTNITEIIYDSIRCSLIHEANLPFAVAFTDRSFFGMENSVFLIPTRFIVALVLAVVASPHSLGEKIDESWGIVLDPRPIPINQLMGDASAVRSYLDLAVP